MSGSFLDRDVPPTLISFAIAPVKAGEVLSPEFKEAGHPVFLFAPADDSAESLKAVWEQFHALCQAGKVRAAWAVENGLAEAVMKMSFGNQIGFRAEGEAARDWYASVMSWGCDPDALSADPFTGAHASVVSSMAKIVAAGADYRKAYLTLQEFFEKLRDEPKRWGKPFSALLGALTAQLELGAAAIGGKDSMSGSFLDRDVPPTLISFAIAPVKAGEVLSPEFKEAGHPVFLFAPADDSAENLKAVWEQFHALCQAGKVRAAWAVENGLAEAVMKMSFGNQIGFRAEGEAARDWYAPQVGAIVAELTEDAACGMKLGVTTAEPVIDLGADAAPIDELLTLNEAVLEDVYPNHAAAEPAAVPVLEAPAFTRTAPKVGVKQPKVLIPVFPGTNCEYDSARAVLRAGLTPEILVVNNQSSQDVAESVKRFAKAARNSQIIFLPGGFSGGDEPEGSGKFITAFFRQPDHLPARRLLRRRRARGLRQVHHRLLPQPRGGRRHHGAAEKAGRLDAGHLQRLPGPDQAGPGALRRDHRYR